MNNVQKHTKTPPILNQTKGVVIPNSNIFTFLDKKIPLVRGYYFNALNLIISNYNGLLKGISLEVLVELLSLYFHMSTIM